MREPGIPWFFTACIFVGLLLPVLVQQGMFLDGVSYACIAKNMANGLGSFSRPFYTATLYPVCHEQPPLVFGLQSLYFRLFGDHFWVERLYSFSMAVLTATGIVLNFQLFQPTGVKSTADSSSISGSFSWLPILIWITSPIVFWSYRNNMLECTMSVFVLFSTYFAVRSSLEKKPAWLIAAALLSAGAVLCKGPVGFFPVAIPFIMGLTFGQSRSWLASAGRSVLLMAGVLAILGGIVYSTPAMQEYLADYLNTRLLPTLDGTRDEAVTNRLHFLADLLSQLIPAILLVTALAWKGQWQFRSPALKPALLWLLTGLAGSLPLVFSPKQSTHYLLPAIPFFAMGFGVLGAHFMDNHPVLDKLTRSASAPSLKFAGWAALLLTTAGSLAFWGQFNRHEATIKDVQSICRVVPAGTIFGTSASLAANWNLHAYFGRIGNLSLDGRAQHSVYLAEKGTPIGEGYASLEIVAKDFDVWKKIDPTQ